jgi:hypothetical protein
MGPIFVAVAGQWGGTPMFNPYDIARRVTAQSSGLTAIADRFGSAAIEPFKVFVKVLRKEHPVDFRGHCLNQDCLEVAFVGIEHGTPKLSTRCFHVTIRRGILIVELANHKDCPGNCTNGSAQAMLGIHDDAAAILTRTPNFWATRMAVDAIDELISTEIADKPQFVGPPISILGIDASGPHWMPGYQGVCPDIK